MGQMLWLLRVIIGALALSGFVAGFILSTFWQGASDLKLAAYLINGGLIALAWACAPRIRKN